MEAVSNPRVALCNIRKLGASHSALWMLLSVSECNADICVMQANNRFGKENQLLQTAT
jgi:hypothetical protein